MRKLLLLFAIFTSSLATSIEISLLPTSIGAGAGQQGLASVTNDSLLQAALDRGGYVRIKPAAGFTEFPVRRLIIRKAETWLDLRGVTLYLPKSSGPNSLLAGPMITVSGCSATIEGGVLFSQELSLASVPLLSLRRDGKATDPGVWIKNTRIWGWTSGPLVETVGAELVSFQGVHLSQDGAGICARLLVGGSSTRYYFNNGCYLSNYGGGNVVEIQGDVHEVVFRDSYMAGKGRGIVTIRRSPENEGEVSNLTLDNFRYEGPGPVVDTTATWLAESEFRGVFLGPGPTDRQDFPIFRTRANARNVVIGKTCKTGGVGIIHQEVSSTN
jgi:hypothetical protein